MKDSDTLKIDKNQGDKSLTCPSCKEKNPSSFPKCWVCGASFGDKLKITQEAYIYVVGIAVTMMKETERTHRIYTKEFFHRAPSDNEIFRGRVFGMQFPLLAMMRVFGEKHKPEWMKAYRECIRFAEEDLSVSEETSRQVVDDMTMLIAEGFVKECGKSGSGGEFFEVFYLKALTSSASELNALDAKTSQEIKRVAGAVVSLALRAEKEVEQNLRTMAQKKQ